MSVSISVDARHLESLLEALAELNFPINPQIYHDAALIYRYPDRHEETEDTTLVEFPAYEAQLDHVRRALDAYGFDPRALHVTGMLEDIHADYPEEPAPAGAPYTSMLRLKRRAAAAG
ncbi:MAG TPA: hypothetical protein VL371_16405 [Gemmataceae bacterium]|nr:hypothetical protein [Gemmataceae bacterium]